VLIIDVSFVKCCTTYFFNQVSYFLKFILIALVHQQVLVFVVLKSEIVKGQKGFSGIVEVGFA